jgi:hypothetical protein
MQYPSPSLKNIGNWAEITTATCETVHLSASSQNRTDNEYFFLVAG